MRIVRIAQSDEYKRFMESLDPDNPAKIEPTINIVTRNGLLIPATRFDRDVLTRILGKGDLSEMTLQYVLRKVRDAGRELIVNGKLAGSKNCIKTAQDLSLVKTLGNIDERELSRALRDALIAEEIAIQQYENIADSTSDEKVKAVLQEIANEEKVHVGELQKLLADMLKDEQGFLDEGAKEVEEM